MKHNNKINNYKPTIPCKKQNISNVFHLNMCFFSFSVPFLPQEVTISLDIVFI